MNRFVSNSGGFRISSDGSLVVKEKVQEFTVKVSKNFDDKKIEVWVNEKFVAK